MGFGAPANGGALDIVFDSEVPRSFTGRTREVISGGQYVTVSGAANVVGSEVQNFIPGSIVVSLLGTDANQAVGIAAHNAGSNEVITVNKNGTYIATVGEASLSGGYPVYVVSGTIQHVLAAIGVAGSVQPVGRALTAAASGTNNYAVISFNFN